MVLILLKSQILRAGRARIHKILLKRQIALASGVPTGYNIMVMDGFSSICAAVRKSYFRIGAPACVVAALSGGADSVLLLRALLCLRDETPFELHAVHVNHGLRENAALDERFCQCLCKEHDIPLQVFHVQVDPRGSLEDAARRARYAAFSQALSSHPKALLALAHHMDDQAETVLMHLLYGSGMAGLCGMGELNSCFWRPLLSIRRDEIQQALADLKQPWREDESNQDTAYTRNHIRASAMPLLEQITPSAVPAICRAADILHDEDALLNDMAQSALAGQCGKNSQRFILLGALQSHPPAMQRRMLRLYAAQSGIMLDFEQTERLRSLLVEKIGSTANLPLGWRALRTQKRLHLTPPQPVPATVSGALVALPYDGNPLGNGMQQVFPENVLKQPIVLRTRQSGDYIRPFGMSGYQKLKDYLIDRQIDQPFRDAWPLVCVGSEVLWVVGVGASETLRVKADDCNVKLLAYTGSLPDAI